MRETIGPACEAPRVQPGEDFPTIVRKRLQPAFAMVVVIGPQWCDGNRLFDDDDLHREEIRTAIERGIHVVPVIVNGARVPKNSESPDDVRSLLAKQAVEITDSRWSYDIGVLIQNLEQVLDNRPTRQRFLAQVPPWDHKGLQCIADNPTDEDVDWHLKQRNGQ